MNKETIFALCAVLYRALELLEEEEIAIEPLNTWERQLLARALLKKVGANNIPEWTLARARSA